MPFEFNPNNVDLGFPLFEKGLYKFKISEPKSFRREQQVEGGGVTVKEGISYLVICVEDKNGHNMVGKKYNAQFDLSQDYGEQNAMKFLVAAMGYPATEEGVKAFREKYGSLSWRYNVDDKSAGEGWHIAKEQEIGADMSTSIATKGKNIGEKQQGFPIWLPASAV